MPSPSTTSPAQLHAHSIGSTLVSSVDAQFVAAVKAILGHFAMLPQHYPGMAERYERFREAYPQREEVTSYPCPTGPQYQGGSPLPWMLIELDANSNDHALRNEAFGPVLAFYYLSGENNAPTFLKEMVDFTRTRVWGALSTTLIVRDELVAQQPEVVENAIAALQYGIICLNTWSAMSFELPAATWGGFPGETLDNVASGIGVTGNCLLIRNPEKTVLRAPFQHKAQLKLLADGTTAMSASQLRAVANLVQLPSGWNLVTLIWRLATGSKPKAASAAAQQADSRRPPSLGSALENSATSALTSRRGILKSRGARLGLFAPRVFVLEGNELRWWGTGRIVGMLAGFASTNAELTTEGLPRGLVRMAGAKVTSQPGGWISIVPASNAAARGVPSSMPKVERSFTMTLQAPSEDEHAAWLSELQRVAAAS